MKQKFWSIVILVSLILPGSFGIFQAVHGADGVLVHLRIEGSSATLADENVSVGDCTITDTTGVAHNFSGVAACALKEVAAKHGLETDFKDSGFGLMLMRISDDNTPVDWSKSWGFWVNDDSSSVGLDSYKVQPNDSILLSFAAYTDAPLRITLPETITVGTPIKFIVEQRHGETDADWVWHGSWLPAEKATLKIGSVEYVVPANGEVTTTIADSNPVNAQAYGDGFVRSAVTIINAKPTETSPTPTATPTKTPTTTPTTTPTPTPTDISSNTRHDAADRALKYLKNHQNDEGKIDGDMSTAWSIIAFGANSQSSADIKHNNNSLLASLTDVSLPLATDIERQILAIRASGANPKSFNGHDYVAELKTKYNHSQIGEESLVNDDIFGVLALIAGGEATSSTTINNTVATIIGEQSSDGSWPSGVDMTAAGIQALRAYKSYGGDQDVNTAVSRAREYLKSHQDSHGGFSNNSATTAWTIQAIVSLGENPNDWSQDDGDTPFRALLSYQNDNGSFGWQTTSDTSALMTAYAVPALLETPWPITKLSSATSEDSELLTYTAPQTVKIKASPTIKPTTTVVPRVAGASSNQEVSNQQQKLYAAQTIIASPSAQPSATPTIAPSKAPSGVVPVNTNDRNFTFAMFGLANMGIGVTITRLLSKLFI